MFLAVIIIMETHYENIQMTIHRYHRFRLSLMYTVCFEASMELHVVLVIDGMTHKESV